MAKTLLTLLFFASYATMTWDKNFYPISTTLAPGRDISRSSRTETRYEANPLPDWAFTTFGMNGAMKRLPKSLWESNGTSRARTLSLNQGTNVTISPSPQSYYFKGAWEISIPNFLKISYTGYSILEILEMQEDHQGNRKTTIPVNWTTLDYKEDPLYTLIFIEGSNENTLELFFKDYVFENGLKDLSSEHEWSDGQSKKFKLKFRSESEYKQEHPEATKVYWQYHQVVDRVDGWSGEEGQKIITQSDWYELKDETGHLVVFRAFSTDQEGKILPETEKVSVDFEALEKFDSLRQTGKVVVVSCQDRSDDAHKIHEIIEWITSDVKEIWAAPNGYGDIGSFYFKRTLVPTEVFLFAINDTRIQMAI